MWAMHTPYKLQLRLDFAWIQHLDLNISSKEPPAEVSGYGPALVIFLIALANMRVWLRHCLVLTSSLWALHVIVLYCVWELRI